MEVGWCPILLMEHQIQTDLSFLCLSRHFLSLEAASAAFRLDRALDRALCQSQYCLLVKQEFVVEVAMT